MLRQKFTVQVTTLPDCDDITRFDGTVHDKLNPVNCKPVLRILNILVDPDPRIHAFD